MRTLDDVMHEAAENVRTREQEIPHRHWVSPPASRRRRPLAAFVGGAIVVAAVGLPALWMVTPNNNNQGVGSVGPANQTGLEESATTNPPETSVGQDDSATTAPTVTQVQTPKSEVPYLTVRAAGWVPIEATSRDSGQSVSITFLKMTEDGTGDEVVLELGTGPSGAWRNDFMRELEISGVAEQREVSVRGVDAILWMSETGRWRLQWVEASGAGSQALLLLLDGSNPDVLIELAETLEPMSSDEWAEMITIFGDSSAPSDQAEDTSHEDG